MIFLDYIYNKVYAPVEDDFGFVCRLETVDGLRDGEEPLLLVKEE